MALSLNEDLVRLISDEVLRQFEGSVDSINSTPPTISPATQSTGQPATGAFGCPSPRRPAESRVLTSSLVPNGIPVGVSVRHLHLCRADCDALFGPDYELRKLNDLYQHGQYACEETVAVVGPKGLLNSVRILGPLRNKTQVEVARTDAIRLDCLPPILLSVNEGRAFPVGLVGPRGTVTLDSALIRARRHIHISVDEAASLGLRDGDEVDVKVPGGQGLIFCNTRIRAHRDFRAEMHIDTDEGNAAGICCGQPAFIVDNSAAAHGRCTLCAV